ncbi:uncharacterized protein [Ptychodera flava]|uniref:uncharacterized protein n=1 Tax=Ptychodera flava TaxID=63121 RepID=UPI003969EEED
MVLRGFRRAFLYCLSSVTIIVAVCYVRYLQLSTRNNAHFVQPMIQERITEYEEGKKSDDDTISAGATDIAVTTQSPEDKKTSTAIGVINTFLPTTVTPLFKSNDSAFSTRSPEDTRDNVTGVTGVSPPTNGTSPIKNGDFTVTAQSQEHTPTAYLNGVTGALPPSTGPPPAKNSRTRYILPIKSKMGGGTNCQYEKFKNAVVLSLLTNRTLVMLPFFLHGGHVRGFSIEHLRTFDASFDVDIFARLLPLATLEEYKKSCTHANTKVIGWDIPTVDYENTRLVRYKRVVDIQLPNADAIVNLEQGCTLDDVIETLRDEECVAYATDTLLRMQLPAGQRQDMDKAVAKHLIRTPKIRHAVDAMSAELCKGERYLAYHWRNKTAEQPCYFGHGTGESHCETIKKEVRKMADLAVDGVLDLMEKENIECLYIACPLWSLEIVDIFSERLPRNQIYISQDLKVPPKYQTFFEDYYTLSLVEQEIAHRAAVFVASGYSNWSDFVSEGRIAIGRPTFSIREIARIPDSVDRRVV